MKWKRMKMRWLALILCFAIGLEEPAGSVYAAGQTAVVEAGQDSAGSGLENSGTDEAGLETSKEEPGTGEGETGTSGAEIETGEPETESGQEESSTGEPETESGQEESGTGEPETESGQEEPGTGEPETESGQEEPSTEEPETESGQEESSTGEAETETGQAGTVSGGNQGVTVSGNDMGLRQLIQEAQEEFAKLLEEKTLMALLYLTDTYSVRGEASSSGQCVATLETGATLYLCGVEITQDNVWYQVRFWQDGAEKSGYIERYYLAYADEDWIAWEDTYLSKIFEEGAGGYGLGQDLPNGGALFSANSTSEVEAFPYSYRSALYKLKEAHPNWIFVPMNTGLDFDTAVESELGEKSLIQATSANVSNGWVGDSCPSESGWNYATQSAVAYHMNPANFLTEDYIFQFEQLTFNSSYHSVDAIQNFLQGTFMRGSLPDDSSGRTYAQAFYEIGQNRNLSPIHLASRVYQEQGAGNSGLISGCYPGYEGYYNFFNVNASGSSTTEKIVKGLQYAQSKGWNTRYKSLEGGSATIGNNYILKGQDTIYLEKFNVYKDSLYGLYNHQYMQNIQAPKSESYSTKKMYANAGSLNSSFVFKIPVYDNMPGDIELTLNKTSQNVDLGETVQLKAYLNGEKLDPADVNWTSSDTSVAMVEDGKVVGLKVGSATITASYLGCKATCKIKVIISLKSISLSQNSVRLRQPDAIIEDTEDLTEEEKAENISSIELKVSFNPENTTENKTITWTSSNKKVATVTAKKGDNSVGIIQAVGSGTATITAKASKAGGQTATCKVTVDAPIYKLELKNLNAVGLQEGEKDILYVGQSTNLTAEFWPKNTTSDTKVTWSSDHPEIAEVSGGKVTAKSVGTVKIIAEVGAGEEAVNPSETESAAGEGDVGLSGMELDTAETSVEKKFRAEYEITVEQCSVTFKFTDRDNTSQEISLPVNYGGTVAEDDFPAESDGFLTESPGGNASFVGWYTEADGNGSRFDETTQVYQKQVTLYPYYEEQGKGFYVLPVGDQTYTGSAIKPVIQVYDSVSYGEGEAAEKTELVLNKDYTVSYKNNKKVNSVGGKTIPTVIVKGKGNYSGTAYVYFNIVPKALTDQDITVSDITVAYTGKTIKKAPVVYRGTKKLTAKTDYKVTYPLTGTGAYLTAGVYPIVITGTGGYTGTITVYETITKDVLMSKVSIAKIPNQPYQNELADKARGIGIVPEGGLKVTYKKELLVESQDGGVTGDYTVSYTNNLAAGTATAKVTAVEGSGYTGSKSITYKITATSIKKAKVTGITAREYTGNEEDARQDQATLTLNGKKLEASKDNGVTGDYVVSYSKNTKAGTATVTFKGINEYSGQLKKTYKITKYDIGADTGGRITMGYYTQDGLPDDIKTIKEISEITASYVKGGTKPVILLYDNGQPLTLNKDYTVKYTYVNAVTTEDMAVKKLPKITITGKGNYKGTISGNFQITDGAIGNVGKVTMTVKDRVYKKTKGAWKSPVTLQDVNGRKLKAGTDYSKNLVYTYVGDTDIITTKGEAILRKDGDLVEAADIPQAGAVIRVTAMGKGAYAGDGNGSISADYCIITADISTAKVSGLPTKEYLDGREVKLSQEDIEKIKVTVKGQVLEYGKDYIIDESTYANNVKKGKATVIIRGKQESNYGGQKKITFKITAKKLVWWKSLVSQ